MMSSVRKGIEMNQFQFLSLDSNNFHHILMPFNVCQWHWTFQYCFALWFVWFKIEIHSLNLPRCAKLISCSSYSYINSAEFSKTNKTVMLLSEKKQSQKHWRFKKKIKTNEWWVIIFSISEHNDISYFYQIISVFITHGVEI